MMTASANPPSDVTLFGIRHHGPGSARSLVRSLHNLSPDIVLVEGPPEANNSLALLAEADMTPPVALLIYPPDHLQQAVYYPFAIFSPEWQAIKYALTHHLPVRFMDLPQTHQIAERIVYQKQGRLPGHKKHTDEEASENETNKTTEGRTEKEKDSLHRAMRDPLSLLASAAGYTDSERWWEHLVEQRQNSTALFQSILEAMSTLRAEIEQQSRKQQANEQTGYFYRREAQREAHMRKTIRQARKEGFERIAVVCGAWHTPALAAPFPSAKADNALLKGLPKTKVKATWIPWTYARLSSQSGYGAGITSPGWYHHLWNASPSHTPTQSAASWLTRVARFLREEDLEASSASVIEAVRLAEALAAVRDAAMPGLPELNEATQTVLCFGDPTPLQLIHQQLIISNRIGTVPASTPLIPLQQDLQQQQKRLRLKPEAKERLLTLDLRKELDLGRSHLLHRLRLLGIAWGYPKKTGGKGTFKEAWQLQWEPELSVAIIEAGRWGNTLADATAAYVQHRAQQATTLFELTHLLDRVLLSNLPAAIPHLIQQIQNTAALTSDVTHLMGALPPLVTILRYRDVRQTDSTMVTALVDGLVTRLCIGLPSACTSLDDEAAEKMHAAIASTHSAIKLRQDRQQAQAWSAVLQQLCNTDTIHGFVAGHSCRLLLDEGTLSPTEAARRLGLALSLASEPMQAAAWVEGFLQGSGLLLLHDDDIWQVLDDWLTGLTDDAFIVLLPLLRRTFSQFPTPERRQMGERVRLGNRARQGNLTAEIFEGDRATQSLSLITELLGI